jgi:ADP-ribose pyrophosphatase YjhB (NUDIX family)
MKASLPKYCSVCGSDQIEMIVPEDDNRERPVCRNCSTIHYQNPKVVVGCLATWKNKVLMAKRSIEPRKGLWNLPAGFLELGESVEEGAAREVLEETEAEVKIKQLHTIYNLVHVSQVYMHFLAEVKDGKFGCGPESEEVQLITREEIPWDQIAFSSTAYALKKYFDDPDYCGVHIGGWIEGHED